MKMIHIKISLPDDLPAADEGLIRAQKEAKEAAVTCLWQSRRLSLRQAAGALGVAYRDFLEMLREKGIPLISEEPDEKIVRNLLQQKQDRRSVA